MARGKSVVLETISFGNQTQAHAFFKEMLNRYIPGEIVSPEDSTHLAELFKRHPSYSSKVGPGVNYFEVMPEKFGSQCFCAVLLDGTKEGFSYKKCVTQKGD
ncbi:DCL family protein [Azonexus sp. R2A61]|uniref:DCL family protein n=1 Tax=Azonexus sp. R2A61 TaxID=2744443 RepID=UPI001F1C39C8|nr:DCL family protein [Azonexus sp. R2A61]